jgi:hypothetical protein
MQHSASLSSDSDSATTFFYAENMPLGIQSYDLRLGVTFFGLRFRDHFLLFRWFVSWLLFGGSFDRAPVVYIYICALLSFDMCVLCVRASIKYIRCLFWISRSYIRMIHILRHARVRVCACDGIQASFKHSPNIFSVIMKTWVLINQEIIYI